MNRVDRDPNFQHTRSTGAQKKLLNFAERVLLSFLLEESLTVPNYGPLGSLLLVIYPIAPFLLW